MSKAATMAKVSAKGGFHLFWGLAASTIISAVGVVVVARLLSPSEYGIVAVAFAAPNLIATFRDWGINSAMIKYIAQHNLENKPAKVKSILASGLIFELTLGLLLSAVSFVLSGFLATNIFQRPDIKPLIEIASLNILAGALLTTAQSAFTGIEKMELYSITMLFQSILKTILVPLLVIFGLGSLGAVEGNTIAFVIVGLAGTLMLYLVLYKNLHKPNDDKLEIVENIKTMFKYGLPLSISVIISGFLLQFYNFLIAIYAIDLMIGNYSVATNFAVLITFFSTPITTVLFPAFSKIDLQEEKETLQNVFQLSVKYAALLVIPAATAMITLSQPAISTLFGEEYGEAPLFLALISINYLYPAFGSLSLGNLINSQGKTKVNLGLTLLTTAIGFPLSLLLIPRFGIVGLIITTLSAGVPSLIIGLCWIKEHFSATLDWISSAKILLASATAATITYILLSQLSFSSLIELIIGITIFLFAFVTIAITIGTVNQSDINNLREMLSELGPLGRFSNFLLNIVEKLMTVFHS